MRVGIPVGCALEEMVQQRQDSPPCGDKDPAVNHLSFWLDKAVRGLGSLATRQKQEPVFFGRRWYH